jgi:hypothetical protein
VNGYDSWNRTFTLAPFELPPQEVGNEIVQNAYDPDSGTLYLIQSRQLPNGTFESSLLIGTPGPCGPDCNSNGVPDDQDIANGTSRDCNGNGIPDECDVANCNDSAWCGDCNGNGIPDGCDVTPAPPMFGDRVDVPVVDGPSAIAAADLNNPPDGLLDMIIGSDGSGDVTVYYGQPGGGFGNAATYTISTISDSGHHGFVVDDFNNDELLDFATASFRYSSNVSVLYGQPGGGFGEQFTVEVGSFPLYLAKADFDGDQIDDLAVTVAHDNIVGILKGAVDGTFSVIASPAVGVLPCGIAVGDFNEDGIVDLVTANSTSGNLSVLIGVGNGQFQPAQSYSVGRNPYQVVVGRFDSDAYQDIAVTLETDDRVVVLYGQAGGLFDPVNHRRDLIAGDSPYAIASADLNRDGFLDLVVSNYYSDSVTVFAGDAPGAFAARQDFPVGNRPLNPELLTYCQHNR